MTVCDCVAASAGSVEHNSFHKYEVDQGPRFIFSRIFAHRESD